MDYTPDTDICQRYIVTKSHFSTKFIHFVPVSFLFIPQVVHFRQHIYIAVLFP